ncbi:FtsX-like permease family protein [Virgibacillus necropolis]|uniref:ABC transporter permease n=1 Tax=Virgibacillus necropolis TaxID=163877 RepID=A0A221MGX1_9BACI|nr:ABC transporter permease [Virgibacillus necropolis]ASN06870.1 ABC transporter permease [Virgibacillus necropolis]
MTFKQFAFNNVRRNKRQYLSYFLSCMFAVTVFFMYAVIIFHPDIDETEFRQTVERGILMTEGIIYVFSFLFVLYSTGSFIKSRKKEYGLLTTLGITKSQLNRMLILENTIIGIVSIITGLLLGALLTKLFLMVFSQTLGLDEILPFYLSLKAVGITALLFFIMFELNSLAVVWTMRTKSIMEMFRGAKAPNKTPKFSWILCCISLLAIGSAYYLAYTADIMSMFIRMLPILVLIIPGTYFLFTQCSVAFITIMKKKKSYYFRNLNLLTVSDLTFKLKDNARLLFFVAILSAVAFTSSGVLYGLFQSAEVESERFVPQDVSLVTEGVDHVEDFKKEVSYVKKEFKKQGIPYDATTVLSTQANSYSNKKDWNDIPLSIFSFSDYKKMMELHNKKVTFNLNKNEAVVLAEDFVLQDGNEVPKAFTLKSNNVEEKFIVKTANATLNGNIFAPFSVVVPDEVYQNFYQEADSNEIYYNYIMEIPNWTAQAEGIEEILNHADNEYVFPDSQAQFYISMKQGMSFLFFFGIFISVLFFLAAGSILYFRMYQDIDKDLHHFHSLYRIGLTHNEMKKIATKQLAYLFFIPFLVAVVHAGFAFKALQNMLASSIFLPSVVIIAIFFIVHVVNFIFIRNIYTSKLRKVM